MPRTLLLCISIVAAFPTCAAAALTAEDLPLSPATLALARSLGIDPMRDRARFMSEMVRLIYSRSSPDRTSANDETAAGTGDAVRVPVPLSAGAWRAVFRKAVAPE